MIAVLLCLTGCTPQPQSITTRLERSRENLDRASLQGESRYVLRGNVHTFNLTVPASGKLRVGVGIAEEALDRTVPPVEARVTFEADGVSSVLLRRTVGFGQQLGAAEWYDFVVPLEGVAGRQGTLSLAVTTLDGGEAPQGTVRWTNPRVAPATPRVPRTNFILISIDTLRADRLGCYGHDRNTSPNIDRMAREGVLFRRAMSTSSWTMPAHASMLTGLEPHAHGGVRGTQPLDDELVTLAEILWERGFGTAAFTGGGFVDASLGFDQGFSVYRSSRRGPLDSFARNMQKAMSWMSGQGDGPFFLFLHTYEAHTPFAPSPPFDRLFDPDYDGAHRGRIGVPQIGLLQPGGRLFEHMLALYDGLIRSVDQGVGDLLDYLEVSGLARNTCVIFTSDHGEEFLEHGEFGHGRARLYAELLHVPFIFWCPSKFAGGRAVDETISLVDIMPTVLAIAGLPPPEGIQGHSLVSALAGQPGSPGRLVLSETDGTVERTRGFTLALTGDRYKLIETRVGPRKREIFDTTADPGERLDLSDTRPELLELFQPAFDEALALRGGVPSARAPAPRDIDPSLRERLRALGYEP